MRFFPILLCLCLSAFAQDDEPSFSSLKARQIGPAFVSGRVSQIAMFPGDSSHYLVALASGNIFATTNNGTTWTPVFDKYGSYSIGWITIDPKNPSIVWVGTGENNNQRSVSYGDGVYKSEDGGRSFRNVGLKLTEHIARIVVDPRDSNVVYVAAPGPLWKGGGERGLYKTTDSGKTWSASLIKVGDYTGSSDVIMDPRNPDILLAATHQRQRRYFGMIHGGPESALYRSIDAGKTWTPVRGGFPTGDLGRIGLNQAPANPSIIYAQVEGPEERGGTYRSLDNGVTWEKRGSFDQQGQYYSKVQVDPANPDRIYIMNVNIMVSDDGGRSVTVLPTRHKHVDNHDIWVDPKNNNHYLVGSDGGVYESFDRAATWNFKANLPTAQLYDVTVSEDAPFYTVYGGTQDNNSFGCPARNKFTNLTNADCFVTMGGDGFHSRVDPTDSNTVYANMQHGVMVRFDKRTGERTAIQPQPRKGDPPLRWSWDTPLVISPHSHTRLYFGAQKLYRSDDRGDSWKEVSPDLTRALDRNKLPLMGKVWPIDAIQKNVSTALYDNISALAESPKVEGLIYVGTDDGLVQVTENGGATWRKIDKPAGVPEDAYVQRIIASQHDAGTVYAAYDNHQNGDFKPYLIKSTDRGETWTNISGNLPERGSVYAIAEDHVNGKLLFAGTEFGLYWTNTGGEKWMKLDAGLPTIMVRDLAIQKQMDDLVIGTFGRGIYVLDDYSPLRITTPETLKKDSFLFPIKPALSFIPQNRGGELGTSHFTAPNPPVGAQVTYYLKEALTTRRAERQGRHREALARGETPPYPNAAELRAEAAEETPVIVVSIKNPDGKVIRWIDAPTARGVQRVTWDLRAQGRWLPPAPTAGRGGRGAGGDDEEDDDRPGGRGAGPLVLPGKYRLSLAKRVQGIVTPLPGEETVDVLPEGPASMEDRAAMAEYQEKLGSLQLYLAFVTQTATDAGTRLSAIRRAIDATPALPGKMREDALELQQQLSQIALALHGDRVWRATNEGVPASISDRVQAAAAPTRGTTGRPTRTAMEQFQIASEELAVEIPRLRKLVETDIKALEQQLDAAGAPPTPGRLPEWKGAR
jgi:photosystem II stability/assembly factor-like uncharacterized protein